MTAPKKKSAPKKKATAKQSLVSKEPQELQVAPEPVVQNATSMLAVIGKMASSPEVDIDKVERLMALQFQMCDRENELAFNLAMSSAQAEIGIIEKNQRNDQTRSNYSDLGQIVSIVTPIYTKHGINISFDSGKLADECIPITAFVSACGHTRAYNYESPLTDKGIKGNVMMTPAHARGSAISYGRRYLVCMIFNIATVDDDGNYASGRVETNHIDQSQVDNIRSLIEKSGSDEVRFLRHIKASSVEEINAAAYDFVVDLLNKKLASKTLPEYPAEQFIENMPKYRELIEGGKDPAKIIAKLESKYTLSDDQKNAINAAKKTEGDQ